MAYCVDIYRFKNSIEYEYKWSGNYGAKGEKREPKKKATKEQIEKQNQRKKEKYTQRLLKLNFEKSDIWCTFLYPRGTRKPISEVKEDIKKFLRKLRNIYKKRGEELKFIYRIEIGKQGGIHFHMIVNNIQGEPSIDMMIQKSWTQGRVHYERLGGEEEDCINLANYIVKKPTEEQEKKIKEQIQSDDDRRSIISYSCSRNLIKPIAERKEYTRRTVKKLIEDGPQPTDGYYILRDSIYAGVNPYTGMSYLNYTEVRLKRDG